MTPSATTTPASTEEKSKRCDDVDVATPDEDRTGLLNRGMPRDEIIARQSGNQTNTDGAKKKQRRKQTVLEQHCSFFDTNNDGILYPHETYQTCRSFAWSIPLSLFFAGFLHLVQSWGTVPWWHGLPDPLCRIWLHNAHFNKHGSSTMAFDSEGQFHPEVLDEFFRKFDTDGKDGLTFWEGWRGLRRVRMPWDLFGQASAMFEWSFAYIFLWPEDGIIKRKEAHRLLDGSIFHEKVVQSRRQDKKQKKLNAW